MRGAALFFADRAHRAPPEDAPDIVLASDFLNVTGWIALAPPEFRERPCVVYFHENQITYPLSDLAPRDHEFGWINLSSALAASRALFNSSYQRESFLSAVDRVLGGMPDFVPDNVARRIRARSAVFPVGIDFEPHRRARAAVSRREGDPPVIVWNHRWEYDKDPDRMVDALIRLKERGVPFRAILCGQVADARPPAFERAARALEGVLVHQGYFQRVDDYLSALASADIVVSTARHEFFGVSVVEAIYMGGLPLLPRALSYPEIIPEHLHDSFLYDPADDVGEVLERFLRAPPSRHREELQTSMGRYDWSRLAGPLDDSLVEVHRAGARGGAD